MLQLKRMSYFFPTDLVRFHDSLLNITTKMKIAIKSPYSQNNYMSICKYINDPMRIKKEKPRIQCYNSTTSSFHTEMQKLKKYLIAEFVFLSIRKIIKFTETHSEKYSRPLTCRNRVTWPPIYRKVSNFK